MLFRRVRAMNLNVWRASWHSDYSLIAAVIPKDELEGWLLVPRADLRVHLGTPPFATWRVVIVYESRVCPPLLVVALRATILSPFDLTHI